MTSMLLDAAGTRRGLILGRAEASPVLATRTRRGTVRTEHAPAACAVRGLHQMVTSLTFVNPQTCIGWHDFDRLVTAHWAGNYRFHWHCPRKAKVGSA